jgi:two-component system sensor histidine kinase SenX3
MELLLAVAGAVIGFGTGWLVGRARRSAALPDVADAPPAAPTPSFAELVEQHPSGVVVADRQGDVIYRNAAAHALSGTHAGVLLDEVVERHLAAGRAGAASSDVLEMYGPPKISLAVETRPTSGGWSVAFIEDISERRRSDQVRTDFVANISHELKTPIGALMVLAETLEGELDPSVIRRIVERMTDEADRATRTIDDLMELSRIELGGERAIGPVRLADVLAEAVDRVTELAARRAIGISILGPVGPDGSHDDELTIEGDRRQLVSALGNLVENAVKYSEPDRSVRVEARSDGEMAEISVIDRGVGIPQRDRDRIFERFYRVDRARSRDTGGTGLGLSIVRHVVTNHGGEIILTSTEGQGSTFRLRLPLGPLEVDASGTIRGERIEGAA